MKAARAASSLVPVSTPAKPESAFKKSLRAIELGIALGVAGFILNALVAGEIAGRTFQSDEDLLLPRILLLILPSLVIAPATAFAAGLLIEGPRWKIAVSQNVSLTASLLLVPAISFGLDEYFTPGIIVSNVVLCALGTVLSGLALGRAQRRRPEADPKPKPGGLAAIDFEKVKQDAAQPAPEPPPAAQAPAGQPASSEQPAPAAVAPASPAPAPAPATPPATEAPAAAPAPADEAKPKP